MPVQFIYCGGTYAHRPWGEDATITPGWERIGKSASEAAVQFQTWVPLAGAALLAISGADNKIQNWAIKNTPVFGSNDNASKYSNHLLNASIWIYISSAVILPGGDVPGWLLNKSKGLAVGYAAILSTKYTTDGLKALSGRERPDGSNYESFPSGHTSAVAVYTMLTQRNIEYLDMDSAIEKSIDIALNTLTLATGWSRVESNSHYPTDILVGAALGNFIGAFISDSFLGRYSNNIKFSAKYYNPHLYISLAVRF
jgi:membrane-associated phospholipid phosphatase